MSDRNNDRRGRYENNYEDYGYGTPRPEGSSRRSSGYDDAGYANRAQRTTRSQAGGAGGYAAGDRYAASSSYRSGSADSSRRTAQDAGAQQRRVQTAGDGHASADSVDAYRRSSYGSRTSGSSSRPAARGESGYSSGYGDYADGSSARRTTRSGAANRAESSRGAAGGSYGYDSDWADGRTARAASQRPRGSAQARGTRAVAENGAFQPAFTPAGAAGGYASKRSNTKRNIAIAAVIVVVLVIVGAGAAFAYMNSISQNLREGVTEETLEALTPVDQNMAQEPFYMLLLGTDGSADRYASEDFGDDPRSDSMMLARVDPQNKKVALISIHRDTMVDLGGEYGEQKINAAYQLNGAAGAIAAVAKMAGVNISHYASVDFDGFKAIVDALGGVEVEVPMEIDDELAGGHLDAGLQTLNGDQALILCRSRHSYDDVANDGDVMRAANQRVVIGAIAKKVLSADIVTIANTVQAMSKYVSTDLSISDIVGLAQAFQGVDPASDIYTAMEPTNSEYIDETWYEFLDEAAWRKMIQRMDQGLPPVEKTEIDEVTGTVLSTAGNGSTSAGGGATATGSGSTTTNNGSTTTGNRASNQ